MLPVRGSVGPERQRKEGQEDPPQDLLTFPLLEAQALLSTQVPLTAAGLQWQKGQACPGSGGEPSVTQAVR